MKDEKKSRALQACRKLIDVYEESERGEILLLHDLKEVVNIAREAVALRSI